MHAPPPGAAITLLAICGLTHRQSYGNVAMVTIVLPIAALMSDYARHLF